MRKTTMRATREELWRQSWIKRTQVLFTKSRDRELEQGLRGRKYCIREEIQLQRRDVMTDRKRRQAVQVIVFFFFLSISSLTSKSNISVSILCVIPVQVRHHEWCTHVCLDICQREKQKGEMKETQLWESRRESELEWRRTGSTHSWLTASVSSSLNCSVLFSS